MKVKISVGHHPFSGYINIDPASQPESDKVGQYNIIPRDFRDINEILEQAECDEILADMIIDYIKGSQVEDYIKILVSKLKHHGKLTISGTDIFEITRLFYNGEITIEDYNKIVYGDGNHPWAMKSNMSSLFTIKEIMKSLGLKITSMQINGTYYYITGVRP